MLRLGVFQTQGTIGYQVMLLSLAQKKLTE